MHRALGAVLLAAWVTWLVVTVLVQPRLVSDARFREDLASGNVDAWRVVSMTHGKGRSWTENVDLQWLLLGPDGQVSDDDDHSGMVTVSYSTSGTPWTHVVDNTTDPLPPEYLELLRASDARPAATYFDNPQLDRPDWAQWPGPAVMVFFLAALLHGPRPVHGTRWFWFWFAFPTLGLGVVAYAVAEHLWRPGVARAAAVATEEPPTGTPTSAARSTPPDDDRPHRRSGLAGLLTSIALGFCTSFVLTGLVSATGWAWLIRP